METVTGSDPETTVRLRLWPWFIGGVVIGCPLVVVLPVLTLATSIPCLTVALIRRHTRPRPDLATYGTRASRSRVARGKGWPNGFGGSGELAFW